MTTLCGIYCVLSVLCLFSISTAVADNNTPKRELNCTAILIEAAAKRESEVSECEIFRKIKFVFNFDLSFGILLCFCGFEVFNRGSVCLSACQLNGRKLFIC